MSEIGRKWKKYLDFQICKGEFTAKPVTLVKKYIWVPKLGVPLIIFWNKARVLKTVRDEVKELLSRNE